MDDLIRYRIGLFGKVILQVKKIKTIRKHSNTIEIPMWMDATFFDLQELQQMEKEEDDEPNPIGFNIND
jgi:hypothetical protein